MRGGHGDGTPAGALALSDKPFKGSSVEESCQEAVTLYAEDLSVRKCNLNGARTTPAGRQAVIPSGESYIPSRADA